MNRLVLAICIISILGWNTIAPGASAPLAQANASLSQEASVETHTYLPVTMNLIATAPPGYEWPMLGANPQRTSWNSEEVRGDLAVEWYHPIEPYIPYKVQPIAANGKIYVSTARGLYAFSSINGGLSWVYPTELPLGHSPTIATVNGRSIAYVGGYDRKVHAIDAHNGQAVAAYTPYEAAAGFETNPLVVNNTIYAGNRDGYFYALDAITGELKWRYKSDGAILYSAAYKNGVVYFGSNDAFAYALNADTGSLVWKSQKLPGSGFNAYWPVIYTNKSTGKDYAIFSSGENYSQLVLSLTGEETDSLFAGIPQGSYIGPTSSAIPGDWAAGTLAINASVITNYFQNRPDRRTVFVLDASSGVEFTYDSNHDGKAEYAPFTWSTVTHSGSRYPPVVNGIDGVLYQSTAYYSAGWVSRGGPVGWKFGTNYVSMVHSNSPGLYIGHASDEPLAYSAGGKALYWSLCCDREAGGYDITLPSGRPNRDWYYWGYNLANNILAPGYQQMYNDGNASAYNNKDGWQVYSGKNQSKNGIYGKHGAVQSPPIPYGGKLYFLRGNALIAFSPNGSSPKTPLPLATIVQAQSSSSTPTKAELTQRLEAEVQKMIAAGHLRPGYHAAGMIDLFGNGWYDDETEFGEIFDYFQNPADTVYSLLLAYPHLSSSAQQQVKTYLQTYYGPGKTYDFTRIVHIGWGSGAAREAYIIPPEVSNEWGQPYKSPSSPTTHPTCTVCGYWSSFPPFSFYAAWKYAKIIGNNDQAFAKSIFDPMKAKLDAPLSDSTFIKKPYWLNLYIAGYNGYIELQTLAGYASEPAKLSAYQHMLDLRVNNFSKDTPFVALGSDDSTRASYNNTLAVSRNFMFLTPELGNYLNQNLYSKAQQALDEYSYVAPYWFVARFDDSYGEGTFQSLYDSPALFQAKAYILKQPYEELVKWLDVPAFAKGDLFYIQNLAAALSASLSP